ncbi:MAG: SPFH/Band 7/PHB domain protein [Chloroflexi bacterium]|jgi:regulator of protease activity HflC (stomatin/prohibitin superfamily)|nr:SPFH/Band 7/PHB domain protein [Chloroflexota bacterium]MBT4003006.1 SPFH/Band 7/PHB domain protein [Chloroflexota bacterium]MBT4306606.1 SPFH/Band 7/PHB domain protein [Chloroflexota bacterium]MBT4533873.1 SPFH/Band 7/PHB domain protein [Chloroflexota bacterium]MBT4681879.1 SPFH/Band 7/PHB domain protein [Chloroflexota bacterium]
MDFVLTAVFFGLIIFILGIKILRPVEVGIIEFLGRYSKTAIAGFNWVIPFLSKMYRINITERRVDIDPQSIITKDKLNAVVDGVVYYRVEEAQKAIYNVNNFATSVPSLAKTTLRAVIGKMTLTEANENRDQINEEVEKILSKEVTKWGIDVVRVELQRIEPPDDVQDAMNQVVKAENEKIAALDLATAIETKADGERRAEIKKAEGIAAAIRLKADADGDAIKTVNVAAEEYFTGNAQLLKRLETVSEALKNNSKIIVPADSDLVNVIGDLAGTTVPIIKK